VCACYIDVTDMHRCCVNNNKIWFLEKKMKVVISAGSKKQC